MIFITSYLKEDCLYANHIQATSWEEAEKIALENGLGETVDGYIPEEVQE